MSDYIKRKDALEIVNNNLSRFMIALRIGDCPSAEVVPVRHGRWNYDMSGAWCSICGEYSEDECNYCPNCGAKMDEEEDDE